MPNYRLILKDALKDNQIWTEKKICICPLTKYILVGR